MEKSAFDLGLIAAENGSDEAINPFPVSSDEWRDWYDGFRCVCHADVQARRDLKPFYLTPPVTIFTCALAALIDIALFIHTKGERPAAETSQRQKNRGLIARLSPS